MAHAFYVLEGQVRFSVDGADAIAEPGTFAYVAAGLTHTFANDGELPARMLEINAPGGFDAYYAELARAFPPGAPLDLDALRTLQRRHGIVPV
jgi:hypothetical protein